MNRIIRHFCQLIVVGIVVAAVVFLPAVGQARTSLSQLQAQINALQTQVDALEANKADQADIDALQTQIDGLQTQIDDLQAQINALGGSGLIVRDDDGVFVGIHEGGRVIRQIGDQAIRIPLNSEGTGYDESILSFRYESNDCSGPRLVQQATRLIESGDVQGTTLLYAPQLASVVSCFSDSRSSVASAVECGNTCQGPSCLGFIFISPDTCCRESANDICGGGDLYGPVQTLDLNQFTLPFHVEIPEPLP